MGVHSFICYFIQAKKIMFIYYVINDVTNSFFSIIKISKNIFFILYEKYTFFFSHITYFLKHISSFSFFPPFFHIYFIYFYYQFLFIFWWKYNYEGVCVYYKNTFARNLPILLFIYYYHFNQKINLVGILRQDSFFKIILSSTSLPTFLIISIQKIK